MPKVTIYLSDEDWAVIEEYRASVRPIPSASAVARRLLVAGWGSLRQDTKEKPQGVPPARTYADED
jgi:hypothetical protein